jgi:succinate-semialdehyde dehydrogenase/glutarate-semialdehyde dehydrogenase
MALRSINPATLEVIKEIDELSDEQVKQKIDLAQKTFKTWRNVPIGKRAELMKRAADHLRITKDRYGKLMSQEMGKTAAAATAEVEKCATACDFYAENAEKFLTPEVIATDASESFVRFDPIGPVLAVMPWNFPFWQVFRFAAPALMAGNVGLLKHASNVQLSAQAIEETFLAAGFPEGAFLNLAIGSAKVEAVIRDPRVKAVTLTGSEYAGSQVAKQAGEEIKKTVLELGGSDPFIVLADADADAAVSAAVTARMQANAGQSCIAAKRFIVHQDVAEAFTGKLVKAVEALVVGDPLDAKTDVGPLATEQILKDIERQVYESVTRGAKVLTGGKRPKLGGYYYLSTVLNNLTDDMPVLSEEVFGPVLPVRVVKDDAEAVQVANGSAYGLGATIFSQDIAKAKKLAAQIESGSVFINNPVKSDARLPFGGVKKSGYGRELSHYGIKEFVNIKTVWVK